MSEMEGKTPRSRWYSSFPTAGEVEAEFGWPVFLKGARHGARSIVHSSEEFAEAVAAFQCDPILHWRELVVREFVPRRWPWAGATFSKSGCSRHF
ncbi:MAG: hypothetical protein U0931_30195 [Vulcanimicrobiota bacterium]